MIVEPSFYDILYFMKRAQRLVLRLSILAVFAVILVIIIALARGYRFDLAERTLTSRGIISINSAPAGASIYVNDELRGATDTNITLPPDTYDIRVTKDGFTEWTKQVRLLGEIVQSYDIVLFPKNPSLSPLTNIGVNKSVLVGQTDTVLLFSEIGNTEKDGIYILDGNTKRIALTSPLKPIITREILPADAAIASAEVEFAPDYREAIFTFPSKETPENEYSYLLSLEGENTELFDVQASREQLLLAWDRERQRQLGKILETFPKEIESIATDSFRIISFSPDETKILYQATSNTTLPLVLEPPLIGANQTAEERTLEENKVYVYDRKEDKNFPLNVNIELITPESDNQNEENTVEDTVIATETETEATTTPDLQIENYNSLEIFDYIQWYPSSRHLVLNEGSTISIMEYDGANKQAVYSGPYDTSFFALNSDWKLLVLANLNPQNNQNGDIYLIGIR